MTPQPEMSLMSTHNPENERIKRRYFAYLEEAKRRGEPSVDAAATAFELDTRFREFKKFHPEQAVAFKRRLAKQTNARTGKPLAKATIHSTLAALKAFSSGWPGSPDFGRGCRLPTTSICQNATPGSPVHGWTSRRHRWTKCATYSRPAGGQRNRAP
jgi:hypothetical protein